MITNVNLAAPVGALALLGTGFVMFVAAIVLIQSLIVRKRRRAKIVLAALVAVCCLYLAAILIFSIARLPPGLFHSKYAADKDTWRVSQSSFRPRYLRGRNDQNTF